MIHKILETNYKGFHLVYAEESNGWKCVIGEEEILFPHAQAAETAIDEILKDTSDVITKHKGVVIRKVCKSCVTKTVEMDKAY